MSKQSEAKEQQGYKHEGPRCGTCRRFTSDSVPIKWMVEMNGKHIERGASPLYDMTLPANQKESNLRCMIGKFVVKKMGYCTQWQDENE